MNQPNTASLFRVNEVELVYRYRQPQSDRIPVRSSKDAYRIFKASWEEKRIELLEEFRLLMLDNAANCLGISLISTGGLSGCLVDARLLFATALKAKATRLILAHNHPTGNLRPSNADRQLTRNLIEGGRVLNIGILDHLIITPDGYTSLADEGQLCGFDTTSVFATGSSEQEEESPGQHPLPQPGLF